MTKWQPIETAPRDGTPIDLWAFCKKHHDFQRRPDCCWETMVDWDGREYNGWSGINRGRWWSCDFIDPTHWMPLPDPPEDQANGRT